MNRQGWIIVASLVMVAAAGAWWWKSHSARPPAKYRTAAVERGSIESLVSATGTIRPVIQVEVGSQVSGTVQHLSADFNARVHAGQVLCQLDPSSFRARMLQAEAAVAKAEAALKESKRQFARAQELFRQNYVSKAEVEAAEVDVEQRQADLKQANAQREAARVDLANTTIRAPVNGVVIDRSVDVGQTVAASLQAPKLFVIANDLSQMQVETRIDEADIGQIRSGLLVRFSVDAFPDVTFQGRVAQVRLEPIVDQGVVTYTTVIRTDNPDLKLRPGMTANVSVLVARHDDVLKVPNAALRFRPPMDAKRAGRGAGNKGSNQAANAMPPGTAREGAGPGSGAALMRRGGGSGGGGIGAERARPGMSGTGRGAAWAGRMSDHRGSSDPRWRGRGPSDRSEADSATAKTPRSRGGSLAGSAEPIGSAEEIGRAAEPVLKPGTIYLLKDQKPIRVPIMAGITDGAATEVESDELKAGDLVIVGLEIASRGPDLQPPPGMGGPTFRGPGGGGGRPSTGRR